MTSVNIVAAHEHEHENKTSAFVHPILDAGIRGITGELYRLRRPQKLL